MKIGRCIGRTGLSTIFAIFVVAFACSASPGHAYEWEQTETSLALRDGERVVWKFSAGSVGSKPYFHPVSLPDGTVATDHRPTDHPWHLGVWFCFNKINGVGFWGEGKDGVIWGPGRVKVQEVTFEPRDDFSASIAMTLSYCKGDEPLITEHRRYEISVPGEAANTITSHHTFTADTDVVIDRYDYAGIAFRPAPDLKPWRWLVAEPIPGQRAFVFPEKFPEEYGKIKGLLRPPAKWMAIVEKPKGETRGVAILDHPKNPRYPTCWGGLAFNANVWLEDEMRLAKGEKLDLRYRMVFFDNQVLSSFAEEQHALFAGQAE